MQLLQMSNGASISVQAVNNRDVVIKQWLKAIFWVAVLMCFMLLAHATDSTGVADLDQKGTNFQNGIKAFAKWGGILFIVVGGVVLASGQAQGGVAKLIFGIVLGAGVIMGAWGWFSDNFSYGFAF